MFESLHDILNNYFPDIVDEHILKALNRIDWLPVYERVRVDITNFKFWEKLENKTIILHTLWAAHYLSSTDVKVQIYNLELMK